MADFWNMLTASPLFGIVLCLGTFRLGAWLQRKTGIAALNPLLVSILLCCVFLTVTKTPLDNFFEGGDVLSMLLPPATAVLALYIYNQLKLLRQYALPVLVGCTVGSATSIFSILGMCKLVGLDEQLTASLLPKSCTTPIAMSISGSQGGITAITVVAVIITGITGAVLAPTFAKLFRVDNPVAEGLAIGACSHAVGTSKAIELGEIQGAMSGVAIGVCGLISVVLAMFL